MFIAVFLLHRPLTLLPPAAMFVLSVRGFVFVLLVFKKLPPSNSTRLWRLRQPTKARRNFVLCPSVPHLLALSSLSPRWYSSSAPTFVNEYNNTNKSQRILKCCCDNKKSYLVTQWISLWLFGLVYCLFLFLLEKVSQ